MEFFSMNQIQYPVWIVIYGIYIIWNTTSKVTIIWIFRMLCFSEHWCWVREFLNYKKNWNHLETMETMQPVSITVYLSRPVDGSRKAMETMQPVSWGFSVLQSCSCSDDSNSNEGIHAWTASIRRGLQSHSALSNPSPQFSGRQLVVLFQIQNPARSVPSPVPCMLQFFFCFF
jgi:hypothetical protein